MEPKKFNELVELYLEQDLTPAVKKSLKKYPDRQPQNRSQVYTIKKPDQPCEDCDRVIKHRTINYHVIFVNYAKGIKDWSKTCGLCHKKLDK